MGCDVYANNMSIACKAADGKTIAAFPDVCFTPPTAPPTPPGVPIPYPNTGMASDTANGTKTVMISGQEVMMKDSSYFSTSTGDEAGSAPKKGIVTSQNKGKVNFFSWSMDVKFEGANVPRHLDLTGHNEASNPPNTPPWPYLDQMSPSEAALCAKDKSKEESKCKEFRPYGQNDPCPPPPAAPLFSKKAASKFADTMLVDRKGAAECLAARRCSLKPYESTESGKGGCCPGQTGHHLVEASAFHIKGRGDGPADLATGENVPLEGCNNYDLAKAPCICVEGAGHGVGTHGLMHTFQSAKAMKCPIATFKDSSGKLAMILNKQGQAPRPLRHPATTVGQAQKDGAKAVSQTFPESGCDEACIEAQLKAYHETPPPQGAGLKSDQPVKAVHTCKPDADKLARTEAEVAERKARFDAIVAARANVVVAD